jgi:hypothetical protein
MLLPLCNFLGIMLVGLVPLGSTTPASTPPKAAKDEAAVPIAAAAAVDVVDMDCVGTDEPERTGLTRRPAGHDDDDCDDGDLTDDTASLVSEPSPSAASAAEAAAPALPLASPLQRCIAASVVLDFAGCIFCNMGLALAGSGIYQVAYSSVICWSALLSRCVLHKVVTRDEWTGIALVTFGLAFSALGESGGGRNSYAVLMGCLNTMLGAAFYGGNYGAFSVVILS